MISVTLLVTSALAMITIDVGKFSAHGWGESEVMYEWLTVEFDWPSEAMKTQYEQNGRFDPTHNLISAVKTYNDQVYVTVPRLKYTTGVPSTLNKIVRKGGKHVLQPFPDWSSQQLGNCSALQCAMSIEIDPLTGYMYVIDPGRSGIFGNLTGQPPPTFCSPKLVVYDLKANGRLVRSHNFPEDLVFMRTNFLNDIVLDRGNPLSTAANWVYITDAADPKLIIFNLQTNETHTIYHPSMDYEPGAGSDVPINGKIYKFKTPINGLAISADFRFVYYCALGSKNLYQVPARVLRVKGGDFAGNVRLMGPKVSQNGGMAYAQNSLYYGALTKNAVYRWEMSKDMREQGLDSSEVLMKTETLVAQDDVKLQFPDSFTVDDHGYLWFSACRAHLFLLGGIDFSGAQGANYRIWRVNISECSYLVPCSLSQGSTSQQNGQKSLLLMYFGIVLGIIKYKVLMFTLF